MTGSALQLLQQEVEDTCAALGGPNRAASLDGAAVAPPRSPALDALAAVFGLTRFERSVLVLCVGVELDGRTSQAIASANGHPYPTFGLALAALPDAHWSALAPTSPLRRWRLVEPEPGPSLTGARLRIDERVLHLLTGVSYLDPRVDGIVTPLVTPATLMPTHRRIADRVAELLAETPGPRIQLTGPDPGAPAAIAAAACAQLGRRAFRVVAGDLPDAATERVHLQRIWEREAVLEGAVLVLDPDDAAERRHHDAAVRFLHDLEAPCSITCPGPDRRRHGRRSDRRPAGAGAGTARTVARGAGTGLGRSAERTA